MKSIDGEQHHLKTGERIARIAVGIREKFGDKFDLWNANLKVAGGGELHVKAHGLLNKIFRKRAKNDLNKLD